MCTEYRSNVFFGLVGDILQPFIAAWNEVLNDMLSTQCCYTVEQLHNTCDAVVFVCKIIVIISSSPNTSSMIMPDCAFFT